MPRKQTRFAILPNEIIYCIFDFLNTFDIIRAFAKLNHRYNDLVRYYVKRLDLTDGWQGNRQELQWICEMIQRLKIDRFHMDFLDNYRFFRLDSLHLINVSQWNSVVSEMNLKSLTIWVDTKIYSDYGTEQIPQTVIRFSTNVTLDASVFHTNLIDLNVCICNMLHLVKIIKQTPNVQHLSVILADNVNNQHYMPSKGCSLFEAMATGFCYLNNLNRLSFSTKLATNAENNERLSFNQIQAFIDRCCPDKSILKKIVLKLERVIFYQDIWSTIVRYKNTFDSFDFYASFIVEENASKSIEIPSNNDQFDFHIEGNDSSHPYGCYVHIYSLPFAFDKLHGFTSCFELSPRCSFSTVRHLYFTQTRLKRPVSFESLTRRMPHLISIDYDSSIIHDYDTNVLQVTVDRNIFNHLRFLRLKSNCPYKDCVCQNLLHRLLDQMPHLECLTTSDTTFIRGQHSLPTIKQLICSEHDSKSFDILVQRLPHLRTLSLGHLATYPEDLSRLIGPLFIRLPMLYFVSFEFGSWCGNDRTPYKKYIKEAFALTKNMDNRLRRLRLDFGCGRAIFYLLNS